MSSTDVGYLEIEINAVMGREWLNSRPALKN